MRAERGFSLAEAVIVLAVASLVSATIVPVATTVTGRARWMRATSDGAAIRDGVLQLLSDTSKQQVKTRGTTGSVVHLLVTDGDTPSARSAAGDARWQAAVDDATGLVDFLERHLVTNTPGGSAERGWRLPERVSSEGWKGAYLTSSDPDPWGNRYAVNVKFLNAVPSVVVHSAGADEVIDTRFEQNGLVAGGDDIVVLVEG